MSIKTTCLTVKKVWHERCKHPFNGEAHQEAQPKKTRNGEKQ
jgi:hypothetical protein